MEFQLSCKSYAWTKATRSFIILLLPSSLIFLSISPIFTVTKVHTPIFALSRLVPFLFLVIVLTGKLFIGLGVGVAIAVAIIYCAVESFFILKKIQQ